jgi:ABC-type nickel/cobalt efflux system permease component RcnA
MPVTIVVGGRLIRTLTFAAAILAALGIVSIVAAPEAWAHGWAQLGPFGGPRPPAVSGITGWILAKQAVFYRTLSATIHAAKTDGSAVWGLMGISFLYGIFHAAGPGHGKAVISSYLVANEETWRRGVTLSFAAALLQALTAIAIVLIAAAALGATAKMMGDTVRVVELVGYGLIVLIGARLLWVKGGGFIRALRQANEARAIPAAAALGHDKHPTHDHHAHEHDHSHAHACDHDHHHHHHHHHDHSHDHGTDACGHAHGEEPDVMPWGHAHGPEPEELAGPGGWRRGLSAIVAVGLRPCSGAIIVLVFALAQGLLWAGIASTLVMGLGTAITVTAIAALAVLAKGLAKRVAGRHAGYGTVALRGLEAIAAICVLGFGVLLMTGYMATERLVGF